MRGHNDMLCFRLPSVYFGGLDAAIWVEPNTAALAPCLCSSRDMPSPRQRAGPETVWWDDLAVGIQLIPRQNFYVLIGDPLRLITI